jgi:ribonuclease BN (tRNA processing enzyme)
MAKRDATKRRRQPKKKARGVKKSADNARGAKKSAKSKKRDLRSVIKQLDVTSLHSDHITDIMLHCASVLRLKKIIDSPAMTSAQSSASLCYTWPGDTQIVTIWRGNEIVEDTTKEDADARGIRPCG